MHSSRTYRRRSGATRISVLAVLVVLALVVFGVFELTGVTHVFHKAKQSLPPAHVDTAGGGTSNNQKGQPAATDQTDPLAKASKDQGVGANTSLVVPSGDFVSAHHVSLSTTIASVCNTTPAASCSITFTNGSLTKSLPATTVDSNGAAYWDNWTPEGIGLTAGTWQIQAVATLGDQSKNASDASSLVVSP
jgi:hypothetical protein